MLIDPMLISALILASFVAAGVVFSHLKFYAVNPLTFNSLLLKVALVAYNIGWILLTVGPLYIGLSLVWGRRRPLRRLVIVALLWPIAVLVLHAILRVQDGEWFFGYIKVNPILFVTEVVLPVVLLGISRYSKD